MEITKADSDLRAALLHFLTAYRHSHQQDACLRLSVQYKKVKNKALYKESQRERPAAYELLNISPFTEIIDYLGHTSLIPKKDNVASQFSSIRRLHFDIDVKITTDAWSQRDEARMLAIVSLLVSALVPFEDIAFLLVASRAGFHIWTSPVLFTNSSRLVKFSRGIQAAIDLSLQKHESELICDSHRISLQEKSIDGDNLDSTLAIPCSLHRNFVRDKRLIGYTPFFSFCSNQLDPAQIQVSISNLLLVHSSCDIESRYKFAYESLISFFKIGGDVLFEVL